jgi:hypothetical protein
MPTLTLLHIIIQIEGNLLFHRHFAGLTFVSYDLKKIWIPFDNVIILFSKADANYYYYYYYSTSPLSGLGLLFFTFRDMSCFTESDDGPPPNPNLEDHVPVFMTSGSRVAQLYP